MLRLLPLALIACIGSCCYCFWSWGGPEIYFMGAPTGAAWDDPELPDPEDEGEPKPPRQPSDRQLVQTGDGDLACVGVP